MFNDLLLAISSGVRGFAHWCLLQVEAHCGLHALNNAIGYAFMEREHLEEAAEVYLAEALANDNHEQRADHIRTNGWYSEAVLAYAFRLRGHLFSLNLDNQLLADTDRPLRIYAADVRGVVVNMNNAHWMSYRFVDDRIWALDSRYAPRPVSYDEYLANVATYDSRAYAVEVRADAEVVH